MALDAPAWPHLERRRPTGADIRRPHCHGGHTQGKINGAVVDFIMVISPQLSCSIEVAGLLLKEFYPPLFNSLPNCRKDRLKLPGGKSGGSTSEFQYIKIVQQLISSMKPFFGTFTETANLKKWMIPHISSPALMCTCSPSTLSRYH